MTRTRIHNLSISLDGFATGEGQAPDAPMGHAGYRTGRPHRRRPDFVREFLAAGLVARLAELNRNNVLASYI